MCLKHILDVRLGMILIRVYERFTLSLRKESEIMRIDCSITENYLIERNRMFSAGLSELEKTGKRNVIKKCCECNEIEKKAPNKAIAIVQKWSDKHQPKTYREDFRKKFPDAPIIDCPCILYPQLKATCNDYIYCDDCWDKLIEEE